MSALVTRTGWFWLVWHFRAGLASLAGLRWFRAGRSRSFLERACHADRLVLGSSGSSRHWSRSAPVSADSARVGPLVSLRSSATGLASPAGLRWFSSGRLVSAGSARAAPLAPLRSWGRAAGLRWFSSGRLVSAGSARAAPLASLHAGSARAAPLASLRSSVGPLVSAGSARAGWSPLVQLGPAGLRCVRLLHSSVSWSLALRSRTLVSAAHFLSDARSPARANPTEIRLLSSVPHLWSSSFDCPTSQVKRRQKCDRIAPSHPLSWPCVSDLLLLKGES